ncbi:hypothetical protein JI435_422060 [Parastagonospora nodorum SN15]|uniref:Uncharacterized protein n=1 Tax=Phaeosphaeria nodorum (strain SN15 / ATCC MYA-4574 / FGSC 10173) TaxID=321614 RepID=A0A7U2FH09_PHANO|nr:hypothetical protein JI435_422060 [Parastagonospora nodorum SN15]
MKPLEQPIAKPVATRQVLRLRRQRRFDMFTLFFHCN